MTFEARKHFLPKLTILYEIKLLTSKLKITAFWSLGLEKNKNNKKAVKLSSKF